MTSGTLFLVNLAATWYMVGLIWMVQIVHYRLFDRVGRDQFVRYEADHGRLITPVVGIPMLVEIATSAALVFVPFAGFSAMGRGGWSGIGGGDLDLDRISAGALPPNAGPPLRRTRPTAGWFGPIGFARGCGPHEAYCSDILPAGFLLHEPP